MEETIAGFLDGLAARTPSPAGGASAALQAAQGIALLAMVARFGADESLADDLDRRRRRVTELITEDQAAYGGVLAAAPRDRPAALVAACAPQVEVYEIVAAALESAESLWEGATERVRPDLVAGVLALRGAAVVAAGNVRANVADIDTPAAERMRTRVADVAALTQGADRFVV